MNKTVLITGCTTGIGRETAIALAKQQYNLILISRDLQKLKTLHHELTTKFRNRNIHFYACNFEDLTSVVSTAKTIASRYDTLDVLINNAGIWNSKDSSKKEKFGLTWTVNYLAPFLLTYYLRKLLLKTAKITKDVRVINLASEAHRYGKINLNSDFALKIQGTYGATKLANMLYTFKMARILNGYGITVNSVHPGVVSTGLWRSLPKFITWLFDKVLISPQEGAKTMLDLATRPQLTENGKYWANMKVARASRVAQNEQIQDDLYEKTKVVLKSYLD